MEKIYPETIFTNFHTKIKLCLVSETLQMFENKIRRYGQYKVGRFLRHSVVY